MTVTLRQPQPPHVKRWSKEEYLRLVERGGFDENSHVYLFRGEIIEMSPIGTPHVRATMKVANWLYANFRPAFEIRVQMPFDAPGDSMPEPDLAVVSAEQNERNPHPATAVLVIEVADTSLIHDREKVMEYSAAQVPEYWIVDLNSRRIEIYRRSLVDQQKLKGFDFSPPTFVNEDETVSSLALPQAGVKVSELLP